VSSGCSLAHRVRASVGPLGDDVREHVLYCCMRSRPQLEFGPPTSHSHRGTHSCLHYSTFFLSTTLLYLPSATPIDGNVRNAVHTAHGSCSGNPTTSDKQVSLVPQMPFMLLCRKRPVRTRPPGATSTSILLSHASHPPPRAGLSSRIIISTLTCQCPPPNDPPHASLRAMACPTSAAES